MKVKIIRLSKQDAYYDQRKEIVGCVGKWEYQIDMGRKWTGGKFVLDVPVTILGCVTREYFDFAFVKFEQVEDE